MKNTIYKIYTNIFGNTSLLNCLVSRFSHGDIQVADSAKVERRTRIMGNVYIGENVSVSSNVHIRGDVNIGDCTNLNGENRVVGEVTIGKYCAIAPRARMRTLDHPTYKAGIQIGFYEDIGAELPEISKGPIKVRNDVWICSDVKILPDVTIGDGAVIAADSVVVDDVDPYSIVAGNPATHKKYRFDQSTIKALQEISWWNWPEKKQRKNTEFFNADLREVDDVWSLVE